MARTWGRSWLALLLAGGCNDGGGGGSGGGDGRPRHEDYIRGDRYVRLVLEVDAVPGLEPRRGIMSRLADGLTGVLDKPGGIEATTDGTLESRGADHAWTLAELDALAGAAFDLDVPADTIKMHVLYVDGHSADDDGDARILGMAWKHTHLVVFRQTIDETCAAATVPPPVRERLCGETELGILTHEVGHLLGLVNTGTAMVADHQDEAHGAHDTNAQCIMYWANEGTALVDLLRQRLTGGNDAGFGFDPECLRDIEAVRERP